MKEWKISFPSWSYWITLSRSSIHYYYYLFNKQLWIIIQLIIVYSIQASVYKQHRSSNWKTSFAINYMKSFTICVVFFSFRFIHILLLSAHNKINRRLLMRKSIEQNMNAYKLHMQIDWIVNSQYINRQFWIIETNILIKHNIP